MADLLKKEHYDLMAAFEREHRGRMDKEDKSLWPKGVIYQDGHINELFLAFRRGHAYAMAEARASASTQPFDPYVMYGDGFHDGYLKGRREGYEAAEDELSSAPTPPAATAAPSDEEIEALAEKHWECKVGSGASDLTFDVVTFARALLSRYAQAPAASAEAVAFEIRFGPRMPASIELTPFPSRAEEARNDGWEVHELVYRNAPVAAQAPARSEDWTACPMQYDGGGGSGDDDWVIVDNKNGGCVARDLCKEDALRIAAVFSQAPAANGDALDAARYRFIRDVPYCDLVRNVMALQQNAIMDETIDAAMQRTTGSDHD